MHKRCVQYILGAVAALFTAAGSIAADSTWEYSVQVSAAVSSGKVQLTWPQDTVTAPSSYTVYRKAIDGTSWGAGVSLPGSATSYTDTQVAPGNIYEYQVHKVTSTHTGYGYAAVGMEAPLVESRGKVLLLVDAAKASSLATELARLQQDLVGDGWTVARQDVAASQNAAAVKQVIKSAYAADPANMKAVFIVGRVAVPYSGNIVPDGHAPDHHGAWPADVFYGDMDGSWTDSSVNNNGATEARNRNVPGDGKFDQSTLPSGVELQVGRVDFANMPGRKTWGGPATFPSEVELLRRYLNKDHNFRHKKFTAPARALVHDTFGSRGGEAFAASGFRSFAPLVGSSKVTSVGPGLWIPTLNANSHLWAYGCGGGSYASIVGLGNTGAYKEGTTVELVEADIKAVFVMLMGSWLGDWDSEDNIMRGVLATASQGLSCAWSGRPHWFFHHMGVGRTLGYSAQISQNNGPSGLYKNHINSSAGGIHVALMGDPTLRMHVVAPPTSASATVLSYGNQVSWGASPDALQGYHVYRAASAAGPFTRVTTTPVTGTSYTDTKGGSATYMVRAVKLENTTSGSYYNQSQGVFASVGNGQTPPPVTNPPVVTNTPPVVTNTPPVVTNTPVPGVSGTVWIEDALPAGAVSGADGGDSWSWISASPAPFSGRLAHRSATAAGFHQHYFDWAGAPLTVGAGEYLYTYVYLDPANPPRGLMLQWKADNWDHRAYWGANVFNYGTDGTAARKSMGALPAAGQWVRLEVPASAVALEGKTITGMAFSLYDGGATWDATGKTSQSQPGTNPGTPTDTNAPTVSISAPVANATVAGTVTITASATDNVKVAGVQLQVNGVNLGAELTAAPYTASWNTLTAGNGARQISATARDAAGNRKTANVSVTVNNGTTPTNTPPPATSSNLVAWVDDALPAGAVPGANGGDAWTWVSANPAPAVGKAAHQSALAAGLHQHYFEWAGAPMTVAAGDWLYAYVYIDPANPPRELMLQWKAENWDHRAYWGANLITYGTDGTAGRKSMGALPSAGQWVRLEVPASAVALEGKTISGMAFSAYDGRATWDAAGKAVGGAPSTNPGTNSPGPNPNPNPGTNNAVVLWVDDALPAGAVANVTSDTWSWISASPAPASGTMAHQSVAASGLHQHYFERATQTLSVGTGDYLFTYVYLDPANPPQQVMLQWRSDNWEHRAFWGSNLIDYGTNGTAGRRSMGALPAAGQWVRLAVPASTVGLEGHNINGMAFSLYGGRATWDAAGKSIGGLSTNTVPPGSTNTVPPGNTNTVPTLPVITLSATDPNAGESGDVGEFTISRSGATTNSLRVVCTAGGSATAGGDYTMTPAVGSITIPAGSASVTVRVQPVDDTTAEQPETVTLAVTANAAYKLGTSTSATVTLTDNDPIGGGGNDTPRTDFNSTVSVVDYVNLEMPRPGDSVLHVISPTMLELQVVNLKSPDPAGVSMWNWVDANNQFRAPALSEIAVTVNGSAATIKTVGFKRRPFYAPVAKRDLRLMNSLYLELNAPVPDNATVEVRNPSGALWPSSTRFQSVMSGQRYSPAIHVNQEGYMPSFPKKAMVGYYLGSLGEMSISPTLGFKLVDAGSGAEVYQGTLKVRADVGFTYSPLPYQKVLEADFTAFNTPGEYRLVVPGMGASLPFMIDSGIAMGFTRAYAMGLYHQRCGTDNVLPYTRHVHDKCHTAQADVPMPASSFPFTWTCVAGKSADYASNTRHTAPQLKDVASQLYPMQRTGKIDVSGGHHDAGDYSKYTINAAALAHYLVFSVDAFPGVAALDNLGLPNSGDGIGDILQEAKWEVDYLAKIQDTDGGFYFLVYPRDREYEWGVTPDKGDPQVVWPKNTAATAASVAALAQAGSSPHFKRHYPAEAAAYLAKAKLGWQFLMNAINKYGKDGAYQKITHYGNEFMHDDELAWAACEMFLATGDPVYQQKLAQWLNPSDPAVLRWGWWRMYEAWGAAIRSYAFAVRSGRLTAGQVDAAYLAKCEEQVRLCAQEQYQFSRDTSYGSSFPKESKSYRAAGWFFSSERAFDITVGYQLDPKPEYLEAVLANMNFEGGCNPANVSFLTGVGWKRPREVVHQYAVADQRVLPPGGIPQGNITDGYMYMETYKGELEAMVFPGHKATTAPYPFYDRWSDAYNVMTEFVHLDQGRAIGSLAFIAAMTPTKSQAWKSATGRIVVPAKVALGTPTTNITLEVPGMNLDGARIVWEARDHEPAYGDRFTLTPKMNGTYWIEAEAQWPDGRRVSVATNVLADGPTVSWVDDDLPAGAVAGSEGGDGWNWVSSNPAPYSGSRAHQTPAGTGLRQHFFTGAISTITVNAGDKLFAWVYLDPANPPSELMLQWNAGAWDYRAYWGADKINMGANGTASRRYVGPLPETGKWVRLEVPASQVGLEGKTLTGMAFSTFDGRVTWDSAGRTSE